MSNPQKAKGTAYETAIVRYLRERGLRAFKPRQEGHKDVGDVHVEGFVVLQAKNYANLATALRVGLDGVQTQRLNAAMPYGFAVIKRARRPVEDSFVVMRLADLPEVVERLREQS